MTAVRDAELRDPKPVVAVGVEADGVGNMDDVVLYRQALHTYMQVKYAADSSTPANKGYLLKPSDPGGPSTLRKLAHDCCPRPGPLRDNCAGPSVKTSEASSPRSSKVPAQITDDSVVLPDEAHRARTYPDHQQGAFPVILGKLLERAAVTVLFLDERQIVRPTEGLTLQQLQQHAQYNGLSFAHIDLVSRFRCNGSRAYQQWVDHLFQSEGVASAWEGSDYDLAVAADPERLEHWIAEHTRGGRTPRVTAGFCWSWDSSPPPPLLPEVAITWDGPDWPRTWARPWNSGSCATLHHTATCGTH
ncbi:DNA/RNA helicase domain-containing protein [Streptomyces sp. NBC_01334]|uniref:DNA/RNA helicase domain-containing protein n=1 Tax=Streptomyces sp. NBC_01334 TaxID=2903827 RepID=UPI002E0EA841|nr:DUF2075 domain-containing protein [Streptomyces sp. NBC_01334]